MYNFRSLSNILSKIFWSLIFHISHPRLGYFFQSCPILSHCYGPWRAVDGSYAPYKPSVLLTVRILRIYGACISLMTSEHSVLRFVRSVRSARIVTVRMLRAVDGSYAPYKPSELLTVRILRIYGACISLMTSRHRVLRFVRSVRSVRIVTVHMLDWYGPY